MTREGLKSYIYNAIMLGNTANYKVIDEVRNNMLRKEPIYLHYIVDSEMEILEQELNGSVCIDGFYFKIVDEEK